jgi:hypothetical protein
MSGRELDAIFCCPEGCVYAGRSLDDRDALCCKDIAGPQTRHALAAAGYAVADKTTLQIALLVLCAARDGQSWHINFLKDFDQAIDGIRSMLAAAGETKE